MSPFKVLLTSLAASLLVAGSNAFSQGSATNTLAAANDATNEPTRLPTVTVTAQKESQAADTVPVSVTAVTRDTLGNAGIQSVKEASYYAPNTFVNEFTARALSNPFFRGLGGSPLNPGVTTFIDGVPQLNSYSSSLEFVDVDQIEFVRGPQGALFGRNTAGGLINITSRRPSLDTFNASGEGGYGNYNYRDVRASVSGPVVKDQLGLGFSGGYSARDGYSVNDFNGKRVDSREGEFGKAQLRYQLNDRLEMRVILAGEHDHDGDYALGDLNFIRANPHHVNYDFSGGFNHRDVASGTVLLNYSGAAVDVSSASGVVWWKNEGLTDLDYTPNPAATRDNTERDFQFTQEIRLASAKDAPVNLTDDLKLKWQTGAFLFTQNYLQDALNNYGFGVLYQPNSFGPGVPGVFSPPNSQYSPQSQLNDFGLGLYGQATLTAWEKLDVTIGLRGDYENKHADLRTYFTTPDPFLGPPTLLAPRKEYSEVSPQFNLTYHLGSNHIAYASVARGYKAGGFNPISPPGSQEYGTEHSWNYEIGYKANYYDDKLETTLALFYVDWQNLQLNQQIVGGGGQFYIGNAGGADSKGVEFELKYRPVAGWDIFGGGGYNEARFLSGSTAFNANANANQNVGGNWLPYAPTYTANFGTEVSWAPCQHATLYARAEGDVIGNFQYDSSNAARQSAYALANFRAGVRGTHWFLEGWANNATDTHYVPIAIQYGQLGAPSGYVGESGAPATFGFRAGLMF